VVKVNIVRPGEGEILGSGAQQIRILENGEHTDHRLGFAEATIPPGTPSPLQHRHAQHDDGFYVLAGTFRFTIGEDHDRFRPASRRRDHKPLWKIYASEISHEYAS
jgi:quercetin dioxygenase-like cupin family protein